MNDYNISIEGEFIDSFIYSGYLFLLDINFSLNIYKWDNLAKTALKQLGFMQKIQCRHISDNSTLLKKPTESIHINVSPSDLKQSLVSKINIGYWPSDINVYANKLYVASEFGVTRFNFNYDTGLLTDSVEIFNQMSFTISPNTYSRLAIAAGKSGVISFVPQSYKVSQRDIKTLTEDVCTDVDWQSNILLANTSEGVTKANFPAPPNKPDDDNENSKTDKLYQEKIKAYLNTNPTLQKDNSLKFSWIGGDNLYSLTKKGLLTIQKTASESNIEKTTFNDAVFSKIQKAKSSSFGVAFETDRELFIINESTPIKLSTEPVNWRVFPRAKYYANHLHIIENNFLLVKIIAHDKSDFGFDIEKINA